MRSDCGLALDLSCTRRARPHRRQAEGLIHRYALPHDHDVGAVIVGFDRFINYYKIQYAQLCINENPGCKFIATNLDAVTHLTDAQEWAGNGAMTGAIKGCTGQEPTVVITSFKAQLRLS